MTDRNLEIAVTSRVIHAAKADIWNKLGFYEHVNKQPPWALRTILPIPREVEGRHDRVGDICRCRYSDGGYLTKRMTRIVDQQRIEFEIIEQSIRWCDSVKLLGGFIEVNEHPTGSCAVTMLTYFDNQLRPVNYMNCLVRRVIKIMHGFVMEDLEEQLSPVQVEAELA